MAVRSIWKGSIGWGLVNIPAKVAGAVEDKEIHLSNLHKDCGTRIKMPKYCPTCAKFVEVEEVIKGFDVGDSYVAITDEELSTLPVTSSHRVEIMGFVPIGAFTDIRFLEKPYYVLPEKGGEKALVLLKEAMVAEGVVAFCRWCYRQRERPTILYGMGDGFVLHTLRMADEVRAVERIDNPALSERELQMGQALIRGLTTQTLAIEGFQDSYRETLQKLIEAKVSGEVLPAPKVEALPAGDLSESLAQSLMAMGIK